LFGKFSGVVFGPGKKFPSARSNIHFSEKHAWQIGMRPYFRCRSNSGKDGATKP
jgi:hypothetical protein